jgi:hypothetical protein
MNISSLYGSFGTTATSNVAAVGQASASPSSVPPAAAGAATTSISAQGQFFSEMQQLSQTNPTEFKAVASQVAASFQSAASQATGQQAQFLSNLAGTFTQAAQTGSLQPPSVGPSASATASQAAESGQGASAHGQTSIPAGQPGGAGGAHHHHHRRGGGGATLQSSSIQQAFASAMGILTQATSGAA